MNVSERRKKKSTSTDSPICKIKQKYKERAPPDGIIEHIPVPISGGKKVYSNMNIQKTKIELQYIKKSVGSFCPLLHIS